ncbi:hypothetical protein ACOMHN_025234 [Nucella lapillus]
MMNSSPQKTDTNRGSAVSRIVVSPTKRNSVSPTRGQASDRSSTSIGAGWYIQEIGAASGAHHNPSTRDRAKVEHPDQVHEPFILMRWITHRPKLCFALALGCHVFFLALSGILVVSGYDLIPANFENLPLELHDEPWLKREYAWLDRDDYPNRVVRSLPSNKSPTWARAFTREGLLLFYNAGGGGNVFTKNKLQVIQTIEQRVVNVSQFATYCQMTQAGTCTPPVSILRFFDGTYSSVDAVFNDPNFNNIDTVLYTAYTKNETKSAFVYALGKINYVSSSSVSSSLTRTLIPLGWPLQGHSTEKDMLTALAEFMVNHLEPVLSDYLEVSQFEFTFYNYQMMFLQVRAQAMSDMALAVGSMAFIFLFIWFHTRSLFVTALSELGIISSFVETNFIYRVVIGYKYFGYFHVLAMFIILGIGADDLFVFWDAWKATGLHQHPSLAHRLNQAYRKSVISMLVTSLTTMTAFLANALSPLLATSSFGVFAAIMIGINYVSVTTFFPCLVVFYHLNFEDKPHPCCCCWKDRTPDDTDSPEAKYSTHNGQAPGISAVSHNGQAPGISAHNGQAPGISAHNGQAPGISAVSQSGRNSVAANHGQAPSQTSPTRVVGNTSTSPTRVVGNTSTTPTRVVGNTSTSPTRVVGNKSTSPTRSMGGNSTSPTRSRSVSPVKSVGKGSPAGKGSTKSQQQEDWSKGQADQPTQAAGKPSMLVVFFRDYYFAAVTHKVLRWVIVLVLLGCLAGFVYSATKLEPDNDQIQLYTDSHHYSKAIKLNNYGFTASDQDPTITLRLLWGLKENDLSHCHFSSVECKGRRQYDDNFDASTQAAQQALVKVCDDLFAFSDAQVEDHRIRRDLVTGQLEIACFPRNMETFLQADPVLGSVAVTMPWDWTKVSAFMAALNTHYNTADFNSTFTHHLDIPLTYWIWDQFQQSNTRDYQVFNSLFGEETSAFSSNVLSAPNISTGNRIKYLAISVNTTLNFQSLGYTEGIPIIQRWEQFMENQLKTMPAEMQSGFQATRVSWHWMYVQRALVDNAVLGIAMGLSLAFPVLALVDNAVLGIALGLSLAFPVLVLATCNVINGFLATLSIGCVTVCVIGVIPLGGWKLGVLVSLNMCLVVGLAVDFVVHLAEGYHMSHHADRKGRLQQALERMGISVFSGACTTLGASAFMLFAQIQFFFQFGVFMFCTIGFSLLFSMGFYVTIMGILGPQDNIGDIRVLFRKSCACLRPKDKSQTTVSNCAIPNQNGSPPRGRRH